MMKSRFRRIAIVAEMITIKELSILTGRKISYLYKLVELRELPFHVIGGEYRFDVGECEGILKIKY